ncbi:MAG: PQQ-binding-like beta-propeller repeat protein [Candidatus Brocadiae bacterium]|nr:PQQ-binding-like beta-propeller repeat protein [Candidatus Brocadiia bacterium]
MQNFSKTNSKFYGDLDIHMTLSDVFETLGSKKRNGWLVIAHEEQEACFYFDGNSVGLIDIPDTEISFIPEKLYYSSKISSEIYQKIQKQKTSFHFLENYVDKKEIAKLLDTIAFDEICKFFRWKKGYFYFIEESSMEGSAKKYPVSSMFDARDLLMEATRRWDEWAEIEKKIPRYEEIFQHNIMPQKEQPKDEPLGNIWYIAKEHTLEEIIHFSYFSSFTAYKIFSSLFSNKQLRVMTEEELLEYAKKEKINGNFYKETVAYRILYRKTPSNINIYDLLIESYKKQNRLEELKAFYQEIFNFLFTKNVPEYRIKAAKYLKNWKDILSANSQEAFQKRLLLLEMVLSKEIDASVIGIEAVSEGLSLIEQCLREKQDCMALETLKKLIQYAPEDISLRERMVKIALENKDSDELIQQYEAIAKIYEKQNNLGKTEEFYRKLLALSPARIDILPKIKSLSARKMNSVEQKRKLIYIVAISVIAIFLYICYSSYQSNIKEEMEAYKKEVFLAIERGDLDRASSLLQYLEEEEREKIAEKINAKWEDAEQQINYILGQADRLQEQGDMKAALKTLTQALKPSMPERFRQKILLRQGNIQESLSSFEKALSKAQSLEQKKDLENALQCYLEIWKDFKFKKIRERNQIKVPVILYINLPEVNVAMDNEPSLLYQSGNVLYCSPGFQKMTLSMTGYHNAIVYNAFFSAPETWISQEKNVYFLPGATKEVSLSKDIFASFPLGGQSEGELCYADNKVFMACKDDYVYAFENLQSQPSLKWKKKIGTSVSLSSSPCYYEKILYIKGNDGYFYALDTAQEEIPVVGKLPIEWSAMTNSFATASLAYKTLLFGSNTKLFALPLFHKEIRAWEPKWSFSASYPIKAPPAIFQDKAIVGGMDGFLYCFHILSGSLLWKYRIGFPILSYAAISENVAYIGVYGTLYAFEINRGTVLWTKEIGGIVEGAVEIGNNMVFVATYNRTLYAFSTKGEPVWDFKANGVLKTKPSANEKSVFICCEQGWLYTLDIKTGRLIWKYYIGDEYLSSPMIIENKILIGGKRLYTFLNN